MQERRKINVVEQGRYFTDGAPDLKCQPRPRCNTLTERCFLMVATAIHVEQLLM